MWFIRMMLWLQAFASPALLFSVISLFVSYDLRVILIIIGVVCGTILAELIRRKYGLDNFFGRIYGSNDIDKKIGKNKSDNQKVFDRQK